MATEDLQFGGLVSGTEVTNVWTSVAAIPDPMTAGHDKLPEMKTAGRTNDMFLNSQGSDQI